MHPSHCSKALQPSRQPNERSNVHVLSYRVSAADDGDRSRFRQASKAVGDRERPGSEFIELEHSHRPVPHLPQHGAYERHKKSTHLNTKESD